MDIAGYNFTGPLADYQLDNSSGVYAVLGSGNKVVDVGESNDVKARIDNHDRKSCWQREGHNGTFAVCYAPSDRRENIEQDVRRKTNPPCGQE